VHTGSSPSSSLFGSTCIISLHVRLDEGTRSVKQTLPLGKASRNGGASSPKSSHWKSSLSDPAVACLVHQQYQVHCVTSTRTMPTMWLTYKQNSNSVTTGWAYTQKPKVFLKHSSEITSLDKHLLLIYWKGSSVSEGEESDVTVNCIIVFFCSLDNNL
jgi:hypothetical protein